MLGPDTHVYNLLPTPTSIRVLLLAPGKPEDEIFCYLVPCDLEKDHSIDPCVPRPFESTCVVTAKGLKDGNATRQFLLHTDSYIDESQEDAPPAPIYQPESAAQSEPTSDQREQIGSVLATGTDEEHTTNDNWWDLSQLAGLTMDSGTLNSRVRHHPFQRYTALSYVWGSVENPAQITIDGRARFEVTRNLFNALKSLRRPDMAQSIWVDAICINQDDPEEKRVQIGLMRRVYRQAQKVIAYVPQEPEDVEPFSELLGKVLRAHVRCRKVIDSGPGRKHQEAIDGSRDDHEAQTEQQQQRRSLALDTDVHRRELKKLPLKPTGTCIEDHDVPPEDDSIWIAWRRFFASPYFRRIWILQEFTLAKDLYFDNGFYQFEYTNILLAMHAVGNMSRLLNGQYLGRGENAELSRAAALGWRGLEMMNMERVFAQLDLHDDATNEILRQRRRLIDKIRYAFDYDATDSRDRIYALLGLTSDAEHFQHLVSYQPTDTHEVIYRRFAVALIEQGHLLQVLQMACKTPLNLQMPTWVPDWSTPTMMSMAPGISLEKGFRAGGIKARDSARFIQDQLVLTGRVVSRVAFMTSPAQKYSLNAALGGRIQDTFEMLMSALNELAGYLKQNPVETLTSFFYCVTMQLETLESRKREELKDSTFIKDWVLFRTLFARIMDYNKIENHADHKVTFGAFPEGDLAFIREVMTNLAGRRFCVTSDKQVGLVPEQAQLGDTLAIVEGAPVPFVLREPNGRPTEDRKVYNLIGDAYILGVMRGELVGLSSKKAGGIRSIFRRREKTEFAWSRITLV